MTEFHSKNVYVGRSTVDHTGLGVFAAKRIRAKQEVEVAPLLVLAPSTMDVLNSLSEHIPTYNNLHKYVYSFGEFTDRYAVALGCASLYNEARCGEPNAIWAIEESERLIRLTALRTINKDEEIFIQYNDEDDSPASWLEAYISYMEESQQDAVAIQDWETAQRLKNAIAVLNGDRKLPEENADVNPS